MTAVPVNDIPERRMPARERVRAPIGSWRRDRRRADVTGAAYNVVTIAIRSPYGIRTRATTLRGW